MKKIIIIGSGGHAKVILSEILLLKNFKVRGFIDDFIPVNTLIDKENNLFNLGKIKDLKSIVDNNTFGIIGVGAFFVAGLVGLIAQKLPFSSLFSIISGYISLVLISLATGEAEFKLALGFGGISLFILLI